MKKAISVLIVLMYLLSVMQLFSFAAVEIKTGYGYIEHEYITDFTRPNFIGQKSYYGSFPVTGRYYDQLNDEQKEIYNKFDELGNTENSFEVNYASGAFKVLTSEVGYKLNDIFGAAYKAFVNDHPERFWYNGLQYSYSYSISGSYTTIYSVDPTIVCHSSYSLSSINTVYNQLMDAVNSFKPAGVTRYEKLRSIHDYIVTKATYDPDYDNSNAAPYGHQPTGCLLSPYLCVCEGYAESFKIFADREGIPNMLVYSPGHVWNVVLMEDGKWYAIDATWDDPPISDNSGNLLPDYSLLQYSYFLVGSSTPTSGSTTFSEESDHQEEYIFTSSSGQSILNPPLSDTAYSPLSPVETWRTDGTQGNDHPGGSILKDKMLVYLAPGCSIKNCFKLSYSSGSASASGDKTGSSLIYTTTAGVSTSYTVIMHGDVNRDALVNNTDLNIVMNVSVGKTVYSSTAPETYAGDCNGDGVVDAFDLAVLDRYQSGNYSFY